MTPEQIQGLLKTANEVGWPTLTLIFALVIIYMLVKSHVKKTDSNTDMKFASHQALIEVTEHERGVVDDRLKVQAELTDCEKERVRLESYVELIESKQQHAVEEFLDDTHNFDRELDSKDKEILRLTGKLADAETIIAAKDATITTQTETIAEQAAAIIKLTSN